MNAMTETAKLEKPTGLALLRQPFPDHQVNLLPKPQIPNDEWKKLPKGTCPECKGWHATTKTAHLSYVGHAALTDRLLDADPRWNWEPLALDEKGLPQLDKYGGMWVKLTVCGVTRMGYGDASNRTGGDGVKELIGDALRNAGMRFGAALEFWHKGQLHIEVEDDDKGTPWTAELLDLGADAAKRGLEAYREFFGGLSAEARSVLVQTKEHADFKADSIRADRAKQ